MFSLPLAFFHFVLVIFLLEIFVYLFVTSTFLFSLRNFSFFFLLVVYVTCVLLQLFFKCPVCVERYDHLEELCTVARVSFVNTL
jgi:hypothetical protein